MKFLTKEGNSVKKAASDIFKLNISAGSPKRAEFPFMTAQNQEDLQKHEPKKPLEKLKILC